VDEFALIDLIREELGATALGPGVQLGPGDDAAVIALRPGWELVASIDTLVADVHFPADADPELIGQRALRVSLSDLAAMGAEPLYVLVSLTLPRGDADWVRGLARGMAGAAAALGVAVSGGNLARGPLNLAVAVQGQLPAGSALRRSGAVAGQTVYVSGPLGGAAAAVQQGGLSRCRRGTLDSLQHAYFEPDIDLALGQRLRDWAGAAIDLSDGLLQDLTHLCRASAVAVELHGSAIPVAPGATTAQALSGGDDYRLAFTAGELPGEVAHAVHPVGRVVAGAGLSLDGEPCEPSGYRHFQSP